MRSWSQSKILRPHSERSPRSFMLSKLKALGLCPCRTLNSLVKSEKMKKTVKPIVNLTVKVNHQLMPRKLKSSWASPGLIDTTCRTSQPSILHRRIAAEGSRREEGSSQEMKTSPWSLSTEMQRTTSGRQKTTQFTKFTKITRLQDLICMPRIHIIAPDQRIFMGKLLSLLFQAHHPSLCLASMLPDALTMSKDLELRNPQWQQSRTLRLQVHKDPTECSVACRRVQSSTAKNIFWWTPVQSRRLHCMKRILRKLAKLNLSLSLSLKKGSCFLRSICSNRYPFPQALPVSVLIQMI